MMNFTATGAAIGAASGAALGYSHPPRYTIPDLTAPLSIQPINPNTPIDKIEKLKSTAAVAVMGAILGGTGGMAIDLAKKVL